MVKKAIIERYRGDIDDHVAYKRRVEYLLKEDRFTCLPRNYGVAFQHFSCLFRTVVKLNPSTLADTQVLVDS